MSSGDRVPALAGKATTRCDGRFLSFSIGRRRLTAVSRFSPLNNSPDINTAPGLERGIGLLHATALNMSNMVGIGPFITIPALLTALGGPQAMLGWVVALIVALADGLVWSELGAALPGSGGSYLFLREGFGRERWGRLMAFLFIWQFLLSGPLEIASGFIGFGMYLNFLWTGWQ